jgi:hypothetical protein
MKWESRTEAPSYMADPSLKSFLFTLKNSHNLPARKFALKGERKDFAIKCSFWSGPVFGSFSLFGGLDPYTSSSNDLGLSYANDNGLGGGKVLTGSCYFTVKEIAVFEMLDMRHERNRRFP